MRRNIIHAPGGTFKPSNGRVLHYTTRFSVVNARQYAFRHSAGPPPFGAPGNAYKANFAFYDGHVETQGDLQASNPHQWLPKRTVLQTIALWPDAQPIYGGTSEIVIGD